MADKIAKGRAKYLSGENHPNATVSNDLILEIRKRYAEGETQKQIAESLGLSRSYVGTLTRHDRR